jgi:hypothetical protein
VRERIDVLAEARATRSRDEEVVRSGLWLSAVVVVSSGFKQSAGRERLEAIQAADLATWRVATDRHR